jgi:hypothetical protein
MIVREPSQGIFRAGDSKNVQAPFLEQGLITTACVFFVLDNQYAIGRFILIRRHNSFRLVRIESTSRRQECQASATSRAAKRATKEWCSLPVELNAALGR